MMVSIFIGDKMRDGSLKTVHGKAFFPHLRDQPAVLNKKPILVAQIFITILGTAFEIKF